MVIIPIQNPEDKFYCSAEPYTGPMCLLELQDWQSCLPEKQNDSDVFIPSDVDQELREEQAQLLFTRIQFLNPSQDCQRDFKSFWCLLLYGICDGGGQRRLPSRNFCIQMQTESCAEVIEIAKNIPDYAEIIQDCNLFRLSSPPMCG